MTTRDELIAAGLVRPREASEITRSRGFDFGPVLRLDRAARAAAEAHRREGFAQGVPDQVPMLHRRKVQV